MFSVNSNLSLLSPLKPVKKTLNLEKIATERSNNRKHKVERFPQEILKLN